MSEAKIVNAFQAPDGKLFLTAAEYHAYISRDDYIERAKEFTKARGWASGQATRAQNIICDFLAYEDSTCVEEEAA